jgi:tetratricopeptide (TPR) repeat protein
MLAFNNKKKQLCVTRTFIALVLGQQLFAGTYGLPAFADGGQIIVLNNEGVEALNGGNFRQAIAKFEAALKLDPSYQKARENLAVAHNNYGLQLRNTPKEALKQFHMALYLNRSSATTMQNVDGIIRMMGKNPVLFSDRIVLGNDARLAGDFVGALIEYAEACKIKDDASLHVKMGDILRVREDNDRAITEYQLAAKSKDSAEIEVKLGQAYQEQREVAKAIAAYGAALKFNNTDRDVLDALVAGWEEALREAPLAPENHIGIGQAFAYRGDFRQAAEEFKQAIRLSPERKNPTADRLLSGLAAMETDATVNKHVNVGLDLQTKKMYDQAINEYKIALQADSQNDTVWVNLGTAYQAKEDFDNAIDCYQHALKINAKNAAATQGTQTAAAAKQDKTISQSIADGAASFKQGRYDDAIQKYLGVLKLTEDASTWFDLGATYQAKKDYENAIACYDKAIRFDQKNASYSKAKEGALDAQTQPIIDAAIAKHGAKDYAGSIPLYQKALTLRPNNASLWFNLASAQYAAQNYLEAREAYQKALNLDRKNQFGCLYLNGTIDENYGKGDQALGEYQKYLQEAPTGPYAQAAKDRVSILSKNPSQVVKIKSEIELAQLKEAEDAYDNAVKRQSEGKFDEAIVEYKKALQVSPNEAAYWYSMGTAYQAKNDLDGALENYKKAVAIAPKQPEYTTAVRQVAQSKAAPLINSAIEKQTKKNDISGAIVDYEAALHLDPDDAGTHMNLGTAFQAGGTETEKAAAEYRKAIQLDPKNANAHYFLATVLETLNQKVLSIKEYENYLSLAPSGSYATDIKGRLKLLRGR